MPGLARQHLTSVLAAARIGNAQVEGAEVGSQELTFRPQEVQGGHYTFAIGTAGSTTLVLQTILIPLLLADKPSTIELEGGTHNSGSPSFDFLTRSFLPLLARIGAHVEVKLERAGFYPAGGGRIVVKIEPSKLGTLTLMERGKVLAQRALAIVANLPLDIAHRELAVVGWKGEAQTVSSAGPGNVLMLEHLADQLLLPMSVGGGGTFTTLTPSLHTRTNAEVIRMFGVANVRIEESGDRFVVSV